MSKIKARGYRWEKYIAEFLGGKRNNAGLGVDVEARGWLIECKSRETDAGLLRLVEWIRQAEKYTAKYHRPWALAVRLGMRNEKRVFVVMELSEFERLTRHEREGQVD